MGKTKGEGLRQKVVCLGNEQSEATEFIVRDVVDHGHDEGRHGVKLSYSAT